jgi:serine/threonine protein kinase
MNNILFPSATSLPTSFGRYRIDRQLSQGARSAVYLAHDTQLDRPVVLTLFHFLPEEAREAVPRFAREVRLAATLVHPNLCPLYEAGQNSGFFFATMAQVQGKCLSHYIQKGKPLPQRQVAGAVRKVAQALQEAHRHGLVHRNLTPANIIITPSKDPVVINLGLAGQIAAVSGDPRRALSGDLRQAAGNAGAQPAGAASTDLAYLAPEQLTGDPNAAGPASDIYSLGAILYELLTEQAPFQGAPAAVVHQVRTQEPVPPSVYRPDVDPALEAICRKGMAKQIQDRFPSMAALVAALTDYLKKSEQEAIQAVPAAGFPVPIPVDPFAVPQAGSPPVVQVQQVPVLRAGQSPQAVPVAAAFQAGYPAPVAGGSAGLIANPSNADRRMPVWPWIAGGSVLLALLVGAAVFLFWGGSGKKEDKEDSSKVADAKKKSEKKSTPKEPEKVDPDFTSEEVLTVDSSKPLWKVEQKVTVDPVGNSEFNAEIKLPPARHVEFKKKMSRPVIESGKVVAWRAPKMTNVLRYLELESSGAVMEKLDGAFGDDAIKANGREIGWARHRDGRWTSQLTSDPRLVFSLFKKRGTVVTLRALLKQSGTQMLAQMEITLPRGAHNIQVKTKPNRLDYDLPPPAEAGGQEKSKPSLRLETKPHLMAALYKIYGDRKFDHLWVARSVFRNKSNETLTDYRIRFRIADYSSWSRWERSDTVYPGQTVVDAFHPVINTKVRDLKGATPVDIETEYEYTRANGQKVSDSTSERIKILGINEGVFTDLTINDDSTFYERFKDAPLVLASFTSANDPVIHDVVGMLHKVNGGKGASASDEGALLFMQALYDLFRVNIAYEGAKGDFDEGVLHQHLKYGREVLRTKSGTCVNLAILYASVCEAAGLDAYILLIPGHAFPAARLPKSGKVIFVESTGCGGGTAEKSIPFAQAVDYAAKNYQKYVQAGVITEIDIRHQRHRGVTPPELPDLGKNPLEDWKIAAPVYKTTRTMKPPPDPPTTRPEQLANSPIVGVWDVSLNGKKVFLGSFDGNGKFALGNDLNKPNLDGQYGYANNTLVMVFKDKKQTVRLTWTGDGNGFSYAEADRTVSFQRRPVDATFQVLRYEHNVRQDGRPGMAIHVHGQINHAPGLHCDVIGAFADLRGNLLKSRTQAYRDPKGYLMASVRCQPPYPFSVYKDLVLFVPYEAMPLIRGRNSMKVLVNAWCVRDRKFVATKPTWQSFVVLIR